MFFYGFRRVQIVQVLGLLSEYYSIRRRLQPHRLSSRNGCTSQLEKIEETYFHLFDKHFFIPLVENFDVFDAIDRSIQPSS